MTAASLSSLEVAARSFYAGGAPAGMSLMLDGHGKPLEVSTVNGCTGAAYTNASKQVIIAFEGTTTEVQLALDQQILSGAAPGTLAGFSEALKFTREVEGIAATRGVPATNISVTGFSLGGDLAEYVASKTALSGASFAGSGLPGYISDSKHTNFVSYVGAGDPFAQFANDTRESALTTTISRHFDHYGTVVQVGTAADSATLQAFITAASGDSTLTSGGAVDIAAVEAMPTFQTAFANHNLDKYITDIAAAGRLAQPRHADLADAVRSDMLQGRDQASVLRKEEHVGGVPFFHARTTLDTFLHNAHPTSRGDGHGGILSTHSGHNVTGF